MNRTFAIIALLLLIMTPNAFAEDTPRVQIETSMGNIVVELNPEAAPATTANFLNYVESGFYEDTIFHRVIKNFMIQGGGLTKSMMRKPTKAPVANEADNGLKNKIGTIAMARTQDPHSATSQFFINVADNESLDHTGKNMPGWGYCVFGHVVEGMDVVHAIENVPTTSRKGYRDVPAKPIVIKKATLLSKSKEAPVQPTPTPQKQEEKK